MVSPSSSRPKGNKPSLVGLLLPSVLMFVCGFYAAVVYLEGGQTLDYAITHPLPTSASRTTPTRSLQEKSFMQIGLASGTDKVTAQSRLAGCLKDDSSCTRPSCTREACRPWGHYYQTMYQQRLGKYSLPSTEPFQFLEIGHYQGSGFETYTKFLEDAPAELHSMEISCIGDDKWPWGNFAEKNPRYQSLLDQERLHCGDANDVNWLNTIWTTKMHRPDAPPLKVVIDDGAHHSQHMVQTVFFWFPRIEPGGMLIVEDIQPIEEANLFRTQFLPQIMSDLHFCGDPKQKPDEACFPQLYPLLQSIHCEMHICVFERNQVPAIPDLSIEESSVPSNALDMSKCYTFSHPFGS